MLDSCTHQRSKIGPRKLVKTLNYPYFTKSEKQIQNLLPSKPSKTFQFPLKFHYVVMQPLKSNTDITLDFLS